MKQLTDTELKEFAVSLLDKQGLEQYEQFIQEHEQNIPTEYGGLKTENAESQRIRALAAGIDVKFVVTLPALPPNKWLDNTIEKTWVGVNLVALLDYIADMTE